MDGIVGEDTWNSLKLAYSKLSEVFAPPVPLFPLDPNQNLVFGSENEAVRQIQVWLNQLSSVYPEITAQPETGYYGQNTRTNTLVFQELFGLPVTGSVNAATWNQLGTEAQRIAGGT